MQSFARDWMDPTFHFSILLFFLVFHIATFLGLIIGISTTFVENVIMTG